MKHLKAISTPSIAVSVSVDRIPFNLNTEYVTGPVKFVLDAANIGKFGQQIDASDADAFRNGGDDKDI